MTTTTTLSRNFPTLLWMATAPLKWIIQRRKWLVALTGVLLPLILGVVIWWATQLNGLPDVGDPFDVKAFAASTIPDDQNAYILYREAVARLSPRHSRPFADLSPRRLKPKWLGPWSQTDPATQRWVLDNREALGLFVSGTARPEICYPPPHDLSRERQKFHNLQLFDFAGMAGLDGARLHDQGDMAGAWIRYRAIVRLAYQLRVHGSGGLLGDPGLDFAFKRIQRWTSDPRTDVHLLQRALQDVLACQEKSSVNPPLLQLHYIFVTQNLDMWDGRSGDDWNGRFPILGEPHQFPEGLMNSFCRARMFWERDPERSLRLLQLLFRNWLHHADTLPDKQIRPVVQVILKKRGSSHAFPIYPIDPQTRDQIPGMTPVELGRWLESSRGAQEFLVDGWSWVSLARRRLAEHAQNTDLILLLASQLFEREHGRPPSSPKELVGAYLKELPDDGSSELDLSLVPTVEEAAGPSPVVGH